MTLRDKLGEIPPELQCPVRVYRTGFHSSPCGRRIRTEGAAKCNTHLAAERRVIENDRKRAAERQAIIEQRAQREQVQSIALNLAMLLTDAYGVPFDAVRGHVVLSQGDALKLLNLHKQRAGSL